MTRSFRVLRQMHSRKEDTISTSKASQPLRNVLSVIFSLSRFRAILELYDSYRVNHTALWVLLGRFIKQRFGQYGDLLTKYARVPIGVKIKSVSRSTVVGWPWASLSISAVYFGLISFGLLRRIAICSCIYSYTSKPIHRCGRQQHLSSMGLRSWRWIVQTYWIYRDYFISPSPDFRGGHSRPNTNFLKQRLRWSITCKCNGYTNIDYHSWSEQNNRQ